MHTHARTALHYNLSHNILSFHFWKTALPMPILMSVIEASLNYIWAKIRNDRLIESFANSILNLKITL